ncbi:MAG: hypothetical protein WEB55_00270, partial [Acidimicrobiia bacterium]
ATRHHAVTVATIRDPSVQRELETESQDDAGLARTVVAADVDRRRDAATAGLRERGANVIDADVEGLSRRCVAAYVSAKRLARI